MVNSNKLYNLLLRDGFKIQSRSSRYEYILRLLLFPIFVYICNFFFSIFIQYENSILGAISGVISVFVFGSIVIVTFFQIFFVTHRRLHDLNASGWWQLVTFIPLGQILMIGFIFFKGTPGRNKYGSPPEY